MHLGRLRVKGRHVLKDVSFDFRGFEGITVIHGLNLNDGGRNSTNSNAAGKSALFATVKDLLFPDVLLGSKKDRGTDGKVKLEVFKGKNEFVITMSGKSKTRITKNGQELDIHKKASIDKAIAEIVGMSNATFSSLYYLDKLVPHPVALGNSRMRKEFFTDFFDLDGTIDLKKIVSAELAEVKATAKLVASQQAQLDKLLQEQQAEKRDIRELQERREMLLSRQKAAKLEVEVYTKDASLREFLEEHEKTIHNLELFNVTVEKLDGFEDELKRVRKDIRKHERNATYAAELAAYNKRKAKVRQWYVDRSTTRKDLPTLIEKVEKKIALHEAYRNALRKHEERTESLTEKAEAAIEALGDLKKSGVCPTCGQPTKSDKKHDHQAKAKEVLFAAEKALDDHVNSKPSVSKPKDDLKELKALLADYSSAPELDDPPEDPPADLPKQPLEELRKVAQELVDRIEKHSILRNPMTTRVLKMPRSIRKAKKAQEDPTARYLAISDKLTDLEVSIAQAKIRNKQILELQEELESGQSVLDTAEALKILDKAYGANGIRHYRIEAICKRLEHTMNQYARLLYVEDYKFSIDLDKEFSIIVTRNNGKQSDVRRLSGAEQSLFQCLLWCSLMAFTPKRNRPNFVILDEMDAPLSAANLDRFLNALPVMLKLVPHIIVVTPKSEVSYSNLGVPVRYLTMVKDGDSSSLQSLKK